MANRGNRVSRLGGGGGGKLSVADLDHQNRFMDQYMVWHKTPGHYTDEEQINHIMQMIELHEDRGGCRNPRCPNPPYEEMENE